MDEAHKELVKQLRAARVDSVALRDEAADALEAQAAEIKRLKAGGCARDQKTTQWCAEAVAATNHAKLLNKMLGEAEAERGAWERVAREHVDWRERNRERANVAEADRDRLKAALELIAVVDQGCGGNLTFEEMARSAMQQARAALGDAS